MPVNSFVSTGLFDQTTPTDPKGKPPSKRCRVKAKPKLRKSTKKGKAKRKPKPQQQSAPKSTVRREPRDYARRRTLFASCPEVADAAAVVRGALALKLDAAFTAGDLGGALWNGEALPRSAAAFIDRMCDLAEDRNRDRMVKALRGYGIAVFQAIALVLFPELYTDDPLAVGLVPSSGIERVGTDRLRSFAALVGGKRE